MVIRIHNLLDGQSVTLHLPLLCGDLGYDTSNGSIDVYNTSLSNSRPAYWPVTEGVFKVMVKLKLGENKIKLVHKSQDLIFTLIRYTAELPFFVRPVYIVCCDDDGKFQGPDEEDCSVQSALGRITLAAMLAQTFTAEKMNEHGFGHKTFKLEMKEDSEPFCYIFRSQLTLERAHSMTGNELWTYFANEVMSSDLTQKHYCKWLCFMSFTRYQLPDNIDPPKSHSDVLKHTKGHVALGGGGLALFGTGNLHTWAKNVEEIHSRFTDVRKIDRWKFMDDSAYREYYWANYATGLGAAIHELGHTFDLAHTPSGIMARGFDDINRFFTVCKNKSKQQNRRAKSSSISTINSDKEVASIQFADTRSSHISRSVLNADNDGSECCNAKQPLHVILESKFKPSVPHNMTYSWKNYNETTNHQTFHMRSEVVNDEPIKSNGQNPTEVHKRRVTLPISPEGLPQKTPFTEGGAYWYRSSAVLLNFHRWFNCIDPVKEMEQPKVIGNIVQSNNGLCLVELRSGPMDEVFHFWEFTSNFPEELDLKTAQIENLPEDATYICIFVEDRYGLNTKQKISAEDFSFL